MKWQPIETAPKDGRWIVVFRPGAKPEAHYISRVGADYWMDGKCWGKSNRATQPTHWMPLPEPPE